MMKLLFYDTTEDDFKNIWYDYFDLNRDYSEIKSRLSNDPIMKEAVSYGDGIRILNQDLWEAVISFIISASNNIPRIKGIIERLCENFGKQISYMGKNVLHVPRYRYDLFSFKRRFIGYPFRFSWQIYNGRRRQIQERHSYGRIYKNHYQLRMPKKALMTINGVGNKVSDCILLFGLGYEWLIPRWRLELNVLRNTVILRWTKHTCNIRICRKAFRRYRRFCSAISILLCKRKQNRHWIITFQPTLKVDFKTSISWAERIWISEC